MIEQPCTIVKGQRKVLDESDPDAPLEKEPLMIDEEVTVIRKEPITGSLRKTLAHLHQVGGFKARWRGLGVSIVYHMVHGGVANLFATLFGSPLFRPVGYLVSSVLLCRLHMTWTHVMISNPSDLPWYRRIVRGRKVIKTLALPSLVFALAQQLVIIMPIMIWFSIGQMIAGNDDMSHGTVIGEMKYATESEQKLLALRVLVTLATAAATAILILLPAAVTLTRIEASMLPDEHETIVAFDRTLGGVVNSDDDHHENVDTKTLFIEAWRSFDKASRLRLVKFYIKMFFIEVHLVLSGFITVVAEIMLIGPERLNLLVQSGSAQLQLLAMGVDGGF